MEAGGGAHRDVDIAVHTTNSFPLKYVSQGGPPCEASGRHPTAAISSRRDKDERGKVQP
jgi:hypothetical protein